MKVIFQQDVRGQGKKGEMKEVSEGYGRNYLLPRKLAVEATADNLNAMRMRDKAKAAALAAEFCAYIFCFLTQIYVFTRHAKCVCTVITGKGCTNSAAF